MSSALEPVLSPAPRDTQCSDHTLFSTQVGAISLHALPGLVAWVAGIIAVTELNEGYNGRWTGVQAGRCGVGVS